MSVSKKRKALTVSAGVVALVLIVAGVLERISPPPVRSLPQEETTFRSRRAETAAVSPALPKLKPERDRQSDEEQAIRSLLQQWRKTMLAGNPKENAACYAPLVDRYFRQRNVSRSEVTADKRQMMRKWPDLRDYTLSNIRVRFVSDSKATATFRKTWDARSGSRKFSGDEDQRLTFSRFDGNWQISGEEELKVYRVSRPGRQRR